MGTAIIRNIYMFYIITIISYTFVCHNILYIEMFNIYIYIYANNINEQSKTGIDIHSQ